jgi:hypothetical protein
MGTVDMARPVTAAPFPAVDIGRIMGDLNSSFNPLHTEFLLDFHVSGARDGFVYLSIALPEGMTRVFVSMLENMAGFFRFIDIKTRSASAQAKAGNVDLDETARRDRVGEEFSVQVCAIYDELISQAVTPLEAVRRTNSALKERKHPWATYDTIQRVLRSSGRFKKPRAAKGRP